MAHDVGLHVGIRVDQRVADAGLGGEVDHVGDAGGRARDGFDGGPVGNVGAVQREAGAGEARDPGFLQSGVVVGVEVVDPDDRSARCGQAFGDMVANEARHSG